MDESVASSSSGNQSNAKLSVIDLNYALEHNEKLDKIPDIIETNVIYRLALALNTKDYYKCDRYSWKNTGSIPYPKNNPEFIKIYYSCINAEKKKDGRCVKHVYISKTNSYDVLVCYLGNLDIATKHSHGNCKLVNSHVLHHTSASTIQQIDELVTKMPGSTAYKTLVATNGDVNPPRNSSQCQYRRQKYLKNQKITHDEIKNVILLSYEFNGFYKLLQLQPQTLIVLMHDQMKEQFTNLVMATKETVPLYYDTTFSLGEIYVSILAFRHVMFSERPILPLAILMHDTKREFAHDRFVQALKLELPQLDKKCVLVTDREPALQNAFRTHYPTMIQLRCWNHALKDIKIAAKKYYYIEEEIDTSGDVDIQANKKEIIANLMDMITNMLRAPSHADSLIEYENISVLWPQRFHEYFKTFILPIIDELGGWSCRPFDLFDEVSGVTTNPIESLNAAFKRWIAWKELSLDALVQMFFLVLGFYVNEVRRGMCAYGGYHLETRYSNSKRDVALLSLVSAFSPDDAVARMKSVIFKRHTSENDDNLAIVDVEKEFSVVRLDDQDDAVGDENSIENIDHPDTSIISSSPNNRNSVQQETLTNDARATILLQQDLVQYHINTKAFTVRSLDHQSVHAVHMNDPKRLFRCSCPNTLTNCSHVLAVKLFLGMPVDKSDNKVNLGHARKRKRIEDKITKAGGKRPRQCDKEPNNNHTSKYFSSKPRNTNDSQILQTDSTCRVNATINSPTIIRPLTNVTNLPSSSTTAPAPKLVQAIRFLTPINVTLPLNQSNRYVVRKPS